MSNEPIDISRNRIWLRRVYRRRPTDRPLYILWDSLTEQTYGDPSPDLDVLKEHLRDFRSRLQEPIDSHSIYPGQPLHYR